MKNATLPKGFTELARNSAVVLLTLIFPAFAGAQASYTLSYTGAIQTLTLPVGNYIMECWGANGGSIASVGGGGIGGYAGGQFSISLNGTQVNIFVGGIGGSATGITPLAGAGGWNGGGGGAAVGRSGAGGGGASDIRVGGLAATNRILVAGGGGGAAYYGTTVLTNSVAPGGHGGASAGQNGSIINSLGVITPGGGANGANGAIPGASSSISSNGTTCGGGGGGSSAVSSFGGQGTCGGAGGAAGPSASGITGSTGGGGGGYAGGAGGVHGTETGNAGVAGGGGSSYIGGVVSGTTAMFGQAAYVTKPTLDGNGLVIIREICSINMAAIGANSNNAICAPGSVTLTTNAVGNYSWSTGSTASQIIVSPTVTTIYSVTGTSTLNCPASVAYTVLVNDVAPVLSVINTASTGAICPGSTVALTASGASNYTWTSPATNGNTFIPVSTATYVVTGANACGTSSAAVAVSVFPAPLVTAVVSQPTICSGLPVSITAIGNAMSYSLSNGVANGASFFPASTAAYTVTAYSAINCTNSAVVSITVVPTPSLAALASPPLICIGSTATLSAGAASNYTWSSGTASFSSAQSVTVSPAASTVYSLTSSSANCVYSRTLQLFVNPLPAVFAISSPTIICAGKTSTLIAAGALTYTWISPAPASFTTTGASIVVSPTTSSTFSLSASDGTCVNTTTVSVATNPAPVLNIVVSSTSICFGQTVSLAASGASSYTWSATGLNSPPGSVSISESPAVNTQYQLTGINNFGCTSTISQVVLVRTTPTLILQTTKPLVCSGAPSSLTVTAIGSGPFTYTWDANAGGGNSNVAVVNPSTGSVYSVSATNTSSCIASKTIFVSVYIPTFAVNSPTSTCAGGTVNLIASGATSYTWQGGVSFPNYPVTPATSTLYLVSATASSVGVSCIASNTVNVTVYPNPVVMAVASRTQICRKESTNITATGAITYSWTTAQSGSTISVSPVSSNIYTVTGTDLNGCSNSATVQVLTTACLDVNELAGNADLLVYPNPATHQVTVKSDADLSIYLLSETGQLIRSLRLDHENGHRVLINDLIPGLYFIMGGDGKVKEKLVITQ